MGVNGAALQLHSVHKKPYFLLQVMQNPYQYYKWREIRIRFDLSRSIFQSSNPIGQYIIHDYMHICTIALTTP